MSKLAEPIVTGGIHRYPVLDRHGRQIHLGDTLRAQICTGRYGQTKIIICDVTESHWPYCSMSTKDGSINAEFDHQDNVLRCAHKHVDFEHGHETWAEIVDFTS